MTCTSQLCYRDIQTHFASPAGFEPALLLVRSEVPIQLDYGDVSRERRIPESNRERAFTPVAAFEAAGLSYVPNPPKENFELQMGDAPTTFTLPM